MDSGIFGVVPHHAQSLRCAKHSFYEPISWRQCCRLWRRDHVKTHCCFIDSVLVDILPSRAKKRDRVWKPVEVLRRKPQSLHRGCRFSVCVAILGGSHGRARALPVLVRASRSSNPFELPPPFGSECVGCCKSKFSEATHDCIPLRARAISTSSCSRRSSVT